MNAFYNFFVSYFSKDKIKLLLLSIPFWASDDPNEHKDIKSCIATIFSERGRTLKIPKLSFMHIYSADMAQIYSGIEY